MTDQEFFVKRLKAEAPAFVKVIKSVPAERADYRPDPRSRSAAELAWVLAGSARSAVELVEKHRTQWGQPKADGGVAAAAGALDKAQAQLLERVARVDKAGWEREAEFTMDGHAAWKAPLGEMMWELLFDAVHHRGQLSTYIRPMGGKVPSIYGPSADDPGA